MSLFDIKEYRKAKAYLDDIEEMLVRVKKAQKLFEHYNRYKAGSSILYELKKQETILRAHYLKYKTIVESKGRVVTHED